MRFIENGFELDKATCTALASVRSTKKGAHPVCRLWYWDAGKEELLVVGESMLFQCGSGRHVCGGDAGIPFDVEVIRNDVLPHASRGTFVRIETTPENTIVAHVVQEIPEEILVSVPLPVVEGPIPLPSQLRANMPAPDSNASGVMYMHQSHFDSVAKVAKALKATAARVQATSPIRVDLAVPESAGLWGVMLMPVRVEE